MMKVLFVDDDHTFINLLKNIFHDLDGTYVYTGAEGLEQLKHNKFDAVVIDMMMFLDGVTFVKLANGRLKNSKVYFLTNLDNDEICKRTESIKDRIAGVFSKDKIRLLRDALGFEAVK